MTERWTAARSWVGLVGSARSSSASGRDGRQLAGPLDQPALELAAQVGLEAAHAVAVELDVLAGAVGLGCAPGVRPSERRIRCTSTPTTPEPSPRRPKAATASCARSRICAVVAVGDRLADRLAQLVEVDPLAVAALRARIAVALASLVVAARAPRSSAARKNQRSKTSSKRRRSSCDLASVAASASRKSSRSVHGTDLDRGEGVEDLGGADRDALGAQLLAEADELRRRTSRPRRAGAPAALARRSPAGGTAPGEPHPDPLGDEVEVGPVLDDDAHRLAEGLGVDLVGAEQQQRPRPVDRLGDRGRLLEVELADHPDDLDEPAGERLVELGRVQADDLDLALDVGVVEPEVEAAALQRLGQLARVVRGEQDERHRPRLDDAELGDRDLEVGEDLEQHRLELLVGLVDLVDQQDDRLGRGDRREQRAGEQELLAEDVVHDHAGGASSVLRPRPGSAAAACGSSTRRAPSPRRGPRSTAGGSARGRWRARAPSRARSCRRPAGPSTRTGLPRRWARWETSAAESSAR